jgi:hypothetical protein
MDPAWKVAKLCALPGQSGVRVLASLADVDPTTVFNWLRPVERRGTGGLIPSHRQQRIYVEARKRGIPLTAAIIMGVEDGSR